MWIKPEYIEQVSELASNSNVTIHNVWERPDNTVDFWIANGMLGYRGIGFHNEENIVEWLQNWFNHLGGHCGLPHPVYPDRRSMLWDCESIRNANVREVQIDVLIINSPPTSGQCPEYEHGEFYELGCSLRQNGLYVLFAQWEGSTPYTITELAKLSLRAKLIIQSANGPSFPCWTVWNEETTRITLLSPMFLDYQTKGLNLRAANVSQAKQHCIDLGYL